MYLADLQVKVGLLVAAAAAAAAAGRGAVGVPREVLGELDRTAILTLERRYNKSA